MDEPRAVPIKIPDWSGLVSERNRLAAELDAACARIAELDEMLDAAHGLICNAHQKRVDDVTTEDGASPGWAEAARRWIDTYPPITR